MRPAIIMAKHNRSWRSEFAYTCPGTGLLRLWSAILQNTISFQGEFYTSCIDIIGMGASNRPEFTPGDSGEINAYFVEVFENGELQWEI